MTEPTKEQVKEIIKDWIMTIPLDAQPNEEDYNEVAEDILEAINDQSAKR